MKNSADQSEFRSALVSLPELKAVLDDLSVSHVLVGPNGRWSYEKLGRTRNDQNALEQQKLSQLSDVVRLRGLNRFGEWSVKTYRGMNGDLLLFERLPIPIADRLPQNILTRLKKQVRAEGDGIIIGPTGSGKSSLLCWLALQIPDEDVLLISETPPNELPGQHVQHVFPPTSELKRRGFERLIRLSSTVMWDRVSSGEDLATLLASTRAKRRWFTLDAASFHDSLNVLMAWSRFGSAPKLKSVFSVSRSGIGRTEPTTFMTFDGDAWMEHHRQDDSHIEAMVQFDSGIMRASQRISAPQKMIRADQSQETNETDREFGRQDMTGMISAESLSVLRDEAIRSAEMDQPNSVPVGEQTKHYIESPTQLDNTPTSNRVPSGQFPEAERSEPEMPVRSIAAAALNSVLNEASEPEEMNLEDLRITRSDIVIESDLVHITSGEMDALADDYSGVVDADSIAFEEISEVLLEEPEQERTNPQHSAYEDPTRMQRVSKELTGPREAIHQDETFGMTEELTFGEKLELLRKRRHDS